MKKEMKVIPGPLADNPQLAFIKIILGVGLLIAGVYLIVDGAGSKTPLELVAGLILILIGIVLALSSSRDEVKTIYCDKNGYCKILQGNYRCYGGCNSCVFAYRYLTIVDNPYDNDSVLFNSTNESLPIEKSDLSEQIVETNANNVGKLSVSSPVIIGSESTEAVSEDEIIDLSEYDEIVAKCERLKSEGVTENNCSEFKSVIQETRSKKYPEPYANKLFRYGYELHMMLGDYERKNGPTRYRRVVFRVEGEQSIPLEVHFKSPRLGQSFNVKQQAAFTIRPSGDNEIVLQWRSTGDVKSKVVSKKHGFIETKKTMEEKIWHYVKFKEDFNWPDELEFVFRQTDSSFELIESTIKEYTETN